MKILEIEIMLNTYEELKKQANNQYARIEIENGIISGYISIMFTNVDLVETWNTSAIVEFTTTTDQEWLEKYSDLFEYFEIPVNRKFLYKTKELCCGTIADLIGTIDVKANKMLRWAREARRKIKQPNEDLIEFALTHGCDVMDMSTGDIYRLF